jgi:hypothetical protein
MPGPTYATSPRFGPNTGIGALLPAPVTPLAWAEMVDNCGVADVSP